MPNHVRFGKVAGGLLAGFCALALVLGAVYLVTAPPVHTATARVKMEKARKPETDCLRETSEGIDPYWMQTEFELIQSKAILISVITNLNLINRWAAKGKAKTPLELYPVLRRKLRVEQHRSTSLIEIHARSKEPSEAAELANAIATTFCMNRFETCLASRSSAIAALGKELERVEQNLGQLSNGAKTQSEIERLKARREQLLKCLQTQNEEHIVPPAVIIDLATAP